MGNNNSWYAPKQGPIDSLRDFDLPMFFVFFWLMPIAMGVVEGQIVFALFLSVFFTAFFVTLQMYIPI